MRRFDGPYDDLDDADKGAAPIHLDNSIRHNQ
jgi:hypothetical protein